MKGYTFGKGDKVACKLHGLTPHVRFTCDRIILKKLCFKCWVEKISRGLTDYKVKRKINY